MKISSVAWAFLAMVGVTAVMSNRPDVVEGFGFSPGSWLTTYLPQILGLVVLIVNEMDGVPASVKDFVNWLANRGNVEIDTEFADDARKLYDDLLTVLDHLVQAGADDEQIKNVRMALLTQHEKLIQQHTGQTE